MSAAVVLMAYGSPERLEDVPAYYADIRGGRPIRPEAFVVVCAALIALGLVIVASASVSLDRSLLGDHVWRALEARGHVPRVDFGDPDAVLVVETLGEEAGIALLPRGLRTEFPFVKIR